VQRDRAEALARTVAGAEATEDWRAAIDRPDVDLVIVATTNNVLAEIARAAIQAGKHVLVEKPAGRSVAAVDTVIEAAHRGRGLARVGFNHRYHPACRQARALVEAGAIGRLMFVRGRYGHGGRPGYESEWRADPARSGPSNCLGDIGTHAENLLEFITGQKIKSLCADVTTFVGGRALDDDANLLLRLEGGAKGTLVCSQVACGEENNLNVRLYGSKAGIEWRQQEPNTLIFKPQGKPWERFRTGTGAMGDDAKAATRVPPGHPEGYLEAFAYVYKLAIADIRRAKRGEPLAGGYPGVRDGLRGVRFVAKAIESGQKGALWVDL
jgi:predicted dehydrogenase